MENKEVYNGMFNDMWKHDIDEDGFITLHEMRTLPWLIEDIKEFRKEQAENHDEL